MWLFFNLFLYIFKILFHRCRPFSSRIRHQLGLLHPNDGERSHTRRNTQINNYTAIQWSMKLDEVNHPINIAVFVAHSTRIDYIFCTFWCRTGSWHCCRFRFHWCPLCLCKISIRTDTNRCTFLTCMCTVSINQTHHCNVMQDHCWETDARPIPSSILKNLWKWK